MNIVKTKKDPYSIFKYCHLKNNDYVNNFMKNQIWLSNPLKFNDPYDCSVTLDSERINTTMININIDQILDKFPNDEISLNDKTKILSSNNPKEEFLSIIKQIIHTEEGKKELYNRLNLRAQYNTELINNFNTLYKSKLKVSSFSEDNCSLLMWGHYADNHKGFCIEYDVGLMPKEENIKKYLFPIEYTDKIYDITQFYVDNVINKNDLYKYNLLKSILYKSKVWEYEKEWRFVVTNNECKDNIVSTPIPKAIYLGNNIDDKYREEFIKICEKNDIPLFQMQLDAKFFKLNVKTIEETHKIL